METEEKKVAIPIDASGSDVAALIRNFALQLIGLVGAIIAVFGLSDSSMIVKIYRLAVSEQFLPILGVICALLASGWQLYRTRVKHMQLQTLASLPNVPDSVAVGPTKPSPKLKQAVEAATVEIDRQEEP